MAAGASDPLTPAGWHARFQTQAGWIRSIRQFLFGQIRLPPGARLLEAGVGTGAVAEEIHRDTGAQVTGIDLDLERLRFAHASGCPARLSAADALRLPFPSASFDAACCHFLLLWTSDPAAVLKELGRVTRPGGWVLALAEPDYGGRLDFPPQLARLGELQTRALQRQGADPFVGRQLGSLFLQAGLHEIQVGVLGGQWQFPADPTPAEEEWRILAEDLRDALDPADLDRLSHAYPAPNRLIYVPTFYAWAQTPTGSADY